MRNENPVIRWFRDMFSQSLRQPTDMMSLVFFGITGIIIVGVFWNIWKVFTFFFH